MGAKAEVTYRSIVRSGFKLLADPHATPESATAWMRREQITRHALGEAGSDRIVAEESKLWRDARNACPWCGGEPPCST